MLQDCSTLGFTSVDQKGQLPPGSTIERQQCCDTDGCNGLQGAYQIAALKVSSSKYPKFYKLSPSKLNTIDLLREGKMH